MSDLHLHLHLYAPVSGTELLPVAINQLRKILMDMSALATALGGVSTQLTDVGTQLTKATDEIVLALSQAGQTNAAVDAEVAKLVTMAAALKTASQTLDNLNVDQTPVA